MSASLALLAPPLLRGLPIYALGFEKRVGGLLTPVLRNDGSRTGRGPGPVQQWTFALILSPGIFVLAQPPLSCWPLGAIAFAPFYWALTNSAPRQAWTGSLVLGTVLGLLVGAWIPEALVNLGSSRLEAGLALIVSSLWVKGLPFTLVGVAFFGLRRQAAWIQVASAAAGVFAIESVHSVWRWGVPWALLGHSQSSISGVAQLALLGGVPLVSALLAAISAASALAWAGRPGAGRLVPALVAAWLALAGAGLPVAQWARGAKPQGQDVNLLLVQPNLPRGERWAADAQNLNLRRIGLYTEQAVRHATVSPTVVLWPENLLTSPADADSPLESELSGWIDRIGVPTVVGVVRSAEPASPRLYKSSLLWIAPDRGVSAVFDKTRAVPLAESSLSFPGAQFLRPLFGRPRGNRRVQEAGPSRSTEHGGLYLVPALCYEALFPTLIASRREPESRAIVNLADDSWVHGDRVSRQLSAFASFRAIEQRLPLIRVAHGGLSVAFDEFGATITILPVDRYAHAMVTIGRAVPPTAQERLTILGLPLATGLGVWWMLGRFASRWSSRKS